MYMYWRLTLRIEPAPAPANCATFLSLLTLFVVVDAIELVALDCGWG